MLMVNITIVIIAIMSGLYASYRVNSHRFNRRANRLGTLSGLSLAIFSAVVSSLSDAQIWTKPTAFYVGVCLPMVAGLLIATTISLLIKLKKPQVISVGIECSYQNVGIATSAAVTMWSNPTDRGHAICVPMLYGVVEGLAAFIYCFICWKLNWTKAPRDEKFCQMLVTSYEVDADSEHNGGDGEDENEESGDDIEKGKEEITDQSTSSLEEPLL